jgi:hypothetical protein
MYPIQLIQLPLHPSSAWEPTGNIPLAPGILAAAAGLPVECVFPEDLVNTMGDKSLFDELKHRNPQLIGVTLYLWNTHRSVYLLRKLKRWNPELLVVAGGPEVTPDNLSLLNESSIDLFVSGEGESFAEEVLSPAKLKKILSTGQKLLGPVASTDPPDNWPDPYRTGHLAVKPGGSVHIESQRGCASLCSYCAYRRTSPVPRIISADKVLEKIRMLRNRGAEELVFLDPTFNSRADLPALLSGMKDLGLSCFAEVKGDLIRSSAITDAFAAAGFNTLEVGLQTMNMEVLHSIGRGGSPVSVLNGASLLAESGVTPVMDLILGLPGDSPKYIESAAEELVSRKIHDQVQTFCLSVLPGTELKASADSLGVKYSSTPPYTVTRSGSYTIRDLLLSRERISDILGYDADPPPRPVLTDTFPGMEIFVPEHGKVLTPPSVRHGVLRINTEDAWSNRDPIVDRVKARRETDPYCPLDVVLQSEQLFPLDLIEMLNELPEQECYTTEKAKLYGVPGLLRLSVIASPATDPVWLEECSKIALTVVIANSPVSLPGGEIGLLLQGSHDLSMLSALYTSAPHLVFFTQRELELLWNLDVLGLG